jgi:hypothetical protein
MPHPKPRLDSLNMTRFRAIAFAVAAVYGVVVPTTSVHSAEPKPEDIEFFEAKVRPILAARCFKCHGGAEPKAHFRLDSRAGLLKGGDTGLAIVPGKPAESLLIDAINYGDTYQMPPDGKLKPAEIAALTQWVKIGAPWPDGDGLATTKSKHEFNLAERMKHWSFQPIRRHEPPAVKDTAWPRGDIDRFILAKLEAAGLRPAQDADRAIWLRRASFALIGLPPETAEVEAFERDSSANAYEKVVDRLLQSPHFGERWARHWLDLVRYAESRGHEFDYDVPNAWQYRDYVIRAFNADVPYNQFVIEHLAGDLLERPRLHPKEGYNESILGTGFWFLGEWVHSPVDIKQDEAERFDNMIDVMTKTFNGLTVACARCHDHKFDAITQADYYALYGFLRSSEYRQVCFDTLEHNRRIADDLAKLRGQARRTIAAEMVAAQRPVLDKLADYLLAAREAILLGPEFDGAKKQAGFAPAYRAKIERLARERGLAADALTHLVAHLLTARGDAADPLHAWARLAEAKDADQPGRAAELLRSLVQGWRQQAGQADAALKQAKVVVDYADAAAGCWQDGFTFGAGPVRPGDALLAANAVEPILEVATQGAVRRDPAFAGLKLAPAVQLDGGRLSGWVRSGQTFRTPTFTIETGKLFYLVAGPGRAYAAVDSHRMNNGPLHGELLNQWPADAAGKPRWVAHNLPLQKGHRAHLEFTAEGSADLQVLVVVQAESTPGNPLERPNRLLLRAAESAGKTRALKELAAAYAKLLTDSADMLARGEPSRADDAADHAVLANWLIAQSAWLSAAAPEDVRRKLASQIGAFHEQQSRLVAQVRRESLCAPAMWDGPSQDERLFIRGNPKTLGPVVPRRFLEALGSGRTDWQSVPPGSGRLELARQMTDPARNPFITRVIVNRVWHHLFGRGIVESVDNFGVLGKPPTHPELLDYLATSFADDGWSIKGLIRRVTLSGTYRMSSGVGSTGRANDVRSAGFSPSRGGADGLKAALQAAERAEQLDPNNLLLHRMHVRRLEAEAIRDAILAVSGRLDRTAFGPSVPVHLTPFMQGRGRPGQSGPVDGNARRSLYIAIRRNFLSPMMLAFDMPIPLGTMGRRNVSNVPAQALILMNDPFVVEQAGVWAKRVLAAKNASPAERVKTMYRAAFSRGPSDEELAQALAFLQTQAGEHGLRGDGPPTDPRVWADLAHVLFNVKEFVFVQ